MCEECRDTWSLVEIQSKRLDNVISNNPNLNPKPHEVSKALCCVHTLLSLITVLSVEAGDEACGDSQMFPGSRHSGFSEWLGLQPL